MILLAGWIGTIDRSVLESILGTRVSERLVSKYEVNCFPQRTNKKVYIYNGSSSREALIGVYLHEKYTGSVVLLALGSMSRNLAEAPSGDE